MNNFFRQFKAIYFHLILLILTSTWHSSAQAKSPQNNEEIIFGVLPIVSTERLVKRFSPLATYLSKQLKIPVRMETAPSYREFLRRTIEEKRYDILLTAPHFYYLANKNAGYKVIVSVDRPDMHLLIVTRTASKIKTTRDLKGHKLATIDSLSLGTVLLRQHLTRAGINPDRDIQIIETPTHNASLLSAYKGVTDAAALMVSPFNRAKLSVRENMRIIDKTAGTPTIPISVASRVPINQTKMITKLLIELKNHEHGKLLLEKMGWPGFKITDNEQYEQLKDLAEQLTLK